MIKKMSRWGVGPMFALFSIGYGILMLAISRYFYPAFHISITAFSHLITLAIMAAISYYSLVFSK